MDKSMKYEPELGQAMFGQPYKTFAVPEELEQALDKIRDHYESMFSGLSPFANSGERFDCDTFQVHAYSWSKNDQPFNFKYKDIEVSWYKYLGRGMSVNKEISPSEIDEMIEDCINALKNTKSPKHDK